MFAAQISNPDLEAPRPTINDTGDEGDLTTLGETLPRTEREGDFADAILICETIQQGDRDVPSDNLLRMTVSQFMHSSTNLKQASGPPLREMHLPPTSSVQLRRPRETISQATPESRSQNLALRSVCRLANNPSQSLSHPP